MEHIAAGLSGLWKKFITGASAGPAGTPSTDPVSILLSYENVVGREESSHEEVFEFIFTP
jgi:hypothetical protein